VELAVAYGPKVRGIRGAQLRPVVEREAVEGEQVLLGFLEQRGHFRQRLSQSFERVADELAGGRARVGIEDRPEQRGDHPLLVLAHMPERLAQEVD
jgi:hypothetical protein